jgi:hypothetical protein
MGRENKINEEKSQRLIGVTLLNLLGADKIGKLASGLSGVKIYKRSSRKITIYSNHRNCLTATHLRIMRKCLTKKREKEKITMDDQKIDII